MATTAVTTTNIPAAVATTTTLNTNTTVTYLQSSFMLNLISLSIIIS
jgi:hypothetical protein